LDQLVGLLFESQSAACGRMQSGPVGTVKTIKPIKKYKNLAD
jgi:hypothetical protein